MSKYPILFARDCVVGLRGLELPTKRLSAASPELEQRAGLVGFRANGREVRKLFPRVLRLCRKKFTSTRGDHWRQRLCSRCEGRLVTIMEDYRR
jgi:hypothetical protein